MEINRHRSKGSFLRRHSLSIALFFVFAGQSLISWFTGLSDWRGQQIIDKASTDLFPDYLVHWTYEMATSLVADTYGALLLVLFAKWFYEKGSPESEPKEQKRGGENEADR